jgi:hypothetical protein
MAKGSGPSESLRKLPKLTPELSQFIDGMGMYFESQGIPRIGGRMLGALMIAHWPLSAEDLALLLRRRALANVRSAQHRVVNRPMPEPHRLSSTKPWNTASLLASNRAPSSVRPEGGAVPRSRGIT